MNGIVGRPTGVRKLIVLEKIPHIWWKDTMYFKSGGEKPHNKKRRRKTYKLIKNALDGNFLVVQWLRLSAFITRPLGFNLWSGSQDPASHAAWPMKKEKWTGLEQRRYIEGKEVGFRDLFFFLPCHVACRISVSCCCSVAKLCLTLCHPMSCSKPGFPVLH